MGTEKDKEMLPVKSDVVFRHFFADERNEEFLVGFLKSVLRIPEDEYDEIEIADPNLFSERLGGKRGVVDVKLRTKSKRVIHIEIQLHVTEALARRILFYASELITEQIKSGEDYDSIHDVATIVILGEDMIRKDKKYHHRFLVYDPEAKVGLTDALEIHTLELGKLPESSDGTALYDWAKFIDAESEEELRAVGERNREVAKAVIKYRELSADERVRAEHFSRELMRQDIDVLKRHAYAKGMEEGRVEGMEEGIEALFMEGETTSQGAVKGLMRLGLEAKAAEELVQKWETKKEGE